MSQSSFLGQQVFQIFSASEASSFIPTSCAFQASLLGFRLSHLLSITMNGYANGQTLLLELGEERRPLMVDIRQVLHTPRDTIELLVDTRHSLGVSPESSSLRLKLFDRRFAVELRQFLQLAEWTPESDETLLLEAVTGSVDAFLDEWRQDAVSPTSPGSIEPHNREAITWEYMQRQFDAACQTDEPAPADHQNCTLKFMSTVMLRTGNAMDYILGLLHTREYFNVMGILYKQPENVTGLCSCCISHFHELREPTQDPPSQHPRQNPEPHPRPPQMHSVGSASTGITSHDEMYPHNDTILEHNRPLKTALELRHLQRGRMTMRSRVETWQRVASLQEVHQNSAVGRRRQIARQPRVFRPARLRHD